MLRRTGAGAGSHIDAHGFVAGRPELLVEVAASSVSRDMHQQKRAYLRAGVREYLVLRSEDAAVDWFVLRRSAHERLAPDAAGMLRSAVFAGLWLDVPALLAGDCARMLAALRIGMRTVAADDR